MPVRYEDRPLIELRELAVKRGIPYARRLRKQNLVNELRRGRKVNSPKGGIRRSRSRVQKYERCVTKVKESSKKYGRKVNPYAICNKSVYGSKKVKKS